MSTRSMCVAIVAAWFATACSAWAQGAQPTLARHRHLGSGRPDGGRPGQRPAAGLADHRDGGQQRQGRIRIPGGPSRSRLASSRHPCRWLCARRRRRDRDRRRRQRHGGSQAQARAITADQWTNSEWLSSAPGPEELKRVLLNCTDCHSAQRIFESKHTGDEFLQVFDRMGGYYPGASDFHPQRLVGNAKRPPVNAAMARPFADYLAALNLSSKEIHGFDLKPNPRATGRATRVIITEYDLPRKEIQPHDVDRRSRRRRLVLALQRAVPVQARSQDRQGEGLSDPGAEAEPSQGHARSRGRSGRQHLGRHDVPGRHGAVRPQDRDSSASIRCRRSGRPTPPSSRTSRWPA